jgi:hypothetical protein
VKYKEEGKREASISLYSLMPQTLETQRARGLTDMLSEVGGESMGIFFTVFEC